MGGAGPRGRVVRGAVHMMERWSRRMVLALGRGWEVDPAVTVVIAPHPDDETLGCGGTIARLRATGRRVVVVILTDQTSSHGIAGIRRAEARMAVERLGVPAEDLIFLGAPDGALASVADLADRIGAELARADPQLVLVCSAADSHPDHVAAHSATVTAAAASSPSAQLVEYPVWAWVEWPWAVAPGATGLRRAIAPLAAIAKTSPRTVRLGPYRAIKRAALASYESQVGAPAAGRFGELPPEFLALFDQKSELFLRPGMRRWFQPGSPQRRWLRERFPAVREVILAPRRRRSNRRWQRLHERLSKLDRSILQQQILPALARDSDGRPILFVGVEWYTARYDQLFPAGGFVTVDIDERKARYGAPQHLVLDAREIGTAFEGEIFSAVVCNGVFGWGVNTPEDIATCFEGFRRVLDPEGLLVLGWNDVDDRRPPDLAPIARLAGFEPGAGAGLSSSRVDVGNDFRHVYEVYRRV